MLDIINKAVPFARHLGITISEMDATGATAQLPDEGALKNHIGTQHAGALFGLAESASGAALMASCAELLSQAQPVVRAAAIQYRRAARGPVHARASLENPTPDALDRLKRDGRADMQIAVSLRDKDEAEVATARFEWSFRASKAA
ncbi:YiiD C-terminal domain-containing protein [Aureimonas altamirensis]|uniref:YiiD C-terminal domain-containing protein n=1 Tax=Aureimonas altamirensis TaxID=370622 RepID=UPI002553305F|nr:YiiD C-terminal domain-containing protein [Aureimonas altamirensis]